MASGTGPSGSSSPRPRPSDRGSSDAGSPRDPADPGRPRRARAAGGGRALAGLNGYLSYSSNRFGSKPDRGDIFVTPLDAESPIQLTNFTVDDAQSAWSRDGRRIAFKTSQFGSNNLAVMDADGSDFTLVTRTSASARVSRRSDRTARNCSIARRPTTPSSRTRTSGSSTSPTAPSTHSPRQQPVLERVGDERPPVLFARRDEDRLPRRR
jgi:hypothetical protein